MTTNIFTNPSTPTNLYSNSNTGTLPNLPNWQMPNQVPAPTPSLFGNPPPLFGNPFQNQNQQYDQNYVQNLQAEVEHWKKVALEKDKVSEPQIADIEKQLVSTQKGRELLRVKNDGVIAILTKWALQNPMVSQDMQKFLNGWKDKACDYLKNTPNIAKKNQNQQGADE